MDLATFIIIFNLIILESLLSVDNAAVLAVMVSKLPEGQRQKALRYGIIGAYVFRGICLLLATWLVQVIWLKIAGGLYLCWLSYKHWTVGDGSDEIDDKSGIVNWLKSKIGINEFWATVVLVEIMDLAFSIDNVFAAVALSDKFWVIMVGVGIGILAMRFVAGKFVLLMEKYPSLGGSAYLVICLLGVKLILSGVLHYLPHGWFRDTVEPIIESHVFDLIFSACMMLIFFVPLFKKQQKKTDNIYH